LANGLSRGARRKLSSLTQPDAASRVSPDSERSLGAEESGPPSKEPHMPKGKPNILVIWGDDIGQSNLSCYTHGLMG